MKTRGQEKKDYDTLESHRHWGLGCWVANSTRSRWCFPGYWLHLRVESCNWIS